MENILGSSLGDVRGCFKKETLGRQRRSIQLNRGGHGVPGLFFIAFDLTGDPALGWYACRGPHEYGDHSMGKNTR